MSKLTTEALTIISMKATMDMPGGAEKLKELTNWLSQELSAREVPIHLAISAFAILTKGARLAGEKMMPEEGSDAVH